MSNSNSTSIEDVIKSFLLYNPENGAFHWSRPPAKAIRAGTEAGAIDKKGYRRIYFKGRAFQAHRLAWLMVYSVWPVGLIDHINGVKDDNRISNLRDVSINDNIQNQRKAHNRNTSGHLGAHPARGRWRAIISVNGKAISLGTFSTPEEAHQKYVEAKRKYHRTCTI